MLKVLYIHFEYPPLQGGGGSYSNNLVKKLSKNDLLVIVATSGEDDSVLKIDEKMIVRRYAIFMKVYQNETGMLKGVDTLLELIREEKPDIIHTQYLDETLIAKVANINFDIPHVITLHKTPLYRRESLKKNGTWSLFDYICKTSNNKFIAPSLAFRDGLLQAGVSQKNVSVIYPGVDRSIFKKIDDKKAIGQTREMLGLDSADKLVLVPCLLRKRKGLEFIVRSISLLKKKHSTLRLLITGLPGNKSELDIFNHLSDIAAPGLMVEHEKFSNSEMPLLYNIADVTVLGSEAEGLGISLLESMACESPVVGTDVLGIKEVIRNGYNGLVCRYGDTVTFNRVISDILTKPVLRKKLIKNANKLLDNKFNLSIQANNHFRIYKELIAEKSNEVLVIVISKIGEKLYLCLEVFESNLKIPVALKQKNESSLEAIVRHAEDNIAIDLAVPTMTIELTGSDTNLGKHLIVFVVRGNVSLNKKFSWVSLEEGMSSLDDPLKEAMLELKKELSDLLVPTVQT